MSFEVSRREFLRYAGSALLFPAGRGVCALPPDVTLRIGPITQEVAPGFVYKTTAYNGRAPAPVIHLREGIPVTVELINDTELDELVHWHGLSVPVEVDGTAEECSRVVPGRGRIRYTLIPEQEGARYLHSHAMSSPPNLDRGTYSGQYAMVYVEPKQNPGAYDQEVFLVAHEWGPSLVSQAGKIDDDDQADGPLITIPESTMEVEYDIGSVNGRALGSGEPLRVKEGERVLVHILNASATATQRLALAGHTFLIVALDGNPVPVQQLTEVLQVGPGERISALVEMKNSGVWILGAVDDNEREVGRMGTVVEYVGKTGDPQWIRPPNPPWDYTIFGGHAAQVELPPEQILPMVIDRIIDRVGPGADGIERWTINGEKYDGKPTRLHAGRRYRLAFQNRTDDDHPVHLHRYSCELTRVHGRTTSGIRKDVVILGRNGSLEVDFKPETAGLALFHCHQQMHMDNGFKKLFEVV